MKHRILKWFVLLVGAAALAWGGVLLSLGFVGESVTPRSVHTRRTGGERNDGRPNRYTYSIDYEFVTRDGEVVSGHAQKIGNSYSVKAPRRIRYLAAAPWLNAPEESCGIAVYPFAMLGVGAVILWFVGRPRTKRSAKSRVASPPSPRRRAKAPGEPPPVPGKAVPAKDWLRKYRRHARLYAWLFFAGVVLVIGILVRVGLEEWNREWLLATGFAALVTWILAIYSRRKANASWAGVVTSKEVREVRDTRNQEMHTTRTYYIVHVRTDRGKDKKVRVGPQAFEAYREGARVGKVAGLSFPIPEIVDESTGICPVCGNVLNGAVGNCPACGAPVYRLAELQ